MTDTPGPRRCPRCGGSGDIPVIHAESYLNPTRPPQLASCPDCSGTGLLRDEPPQSRRDQ